MLLGWPRTEHPRFKAILNEKLAQHPTAGLAPMARTISRDAKEPKRVRRFGTLANSTQDVRSVIYGHPDVAAAWNREVDGIQVSRAF
jgi:hypothetical protein